MDSAVQPVTTTSSLPIQLQPMVITQLQQSLLGQSHTAILADSSRANFGANGVGLPNNFIPSQAPQPTQESVDISDDDKLALFDEVLQSLHASQSPTDTVPALSAFTPDPLLAQSQFQALATDTIPSGSQPTPVGPSGRAVERSPGTMVVPEVPGLTTVEQEPHPDIPVEVEGFLERVAEHPESLPQEIVLNGNDIALNQQQPPKQAIVIVPITQEDEQLAKGKNTTWSIAWLVEWSHKIIKRFLGKTAYRTTQPAQETTSA